MDSIEPITFNAARMWLAAVAIGSAAFLTRRNRQKGQAPNNAEKQITADGAAGAVTGLGDPAQDRRRNTIIGGICCGTFLTAASLFQQMGIVYTTAGKAGFITALYMLFVPILSFILFKKKNTWLVWTGVLIGVIGMYLLCITDGFSLTYGDMLVCICALLFSCHILCCDHFVRLGNPLFISAIQFTTVAVISSVADPHSLLRYRFGRDRLHPADDRAEIYRSHDRVASDESGISICCDRRCTFTG